MNTTNRKSVKIKGKKTASKSSDTEKNGMSSGYPQEKSEDLKFYRNEVYLFMQKLKRDYKRLIPLYNSCIKVEQERERRNKEEIDRLKKIYHEMQAERTRIKRSRWCRYCESEATYLSSASTNFYCSQECEQKQNELANAMAIKIFEE